MAFAIVIGGSLIGEHDDDKRKRLQVIDAERHAVGAETQDGNAKDQFTDPHDDAGDCQLPNLPSVGGR